MQFLTVYVLLGCLAAGPVAVQQSEPSAQSSSSQKKTDTPEAGQPGKAAAAGAAQQSKVPTAAEQAAPPAEEVFLPGDWAPELLDGIVSSPNAEARDSLLAAAFAAGPAIVPQLQEALKDDRTAEFAAQALAFIGGPQAYDSLAHLADDPRDLNLRRFLYGALAEYQNPKAAQALLDVIARADQEPDRTVTEAAILALTPRAEAGLAAALRQAEEKIQDFVIRDDIENAAEVIDSHVRYLASPEAQVAGVSVDRAVRAYFYAALESASPPAAPAKATPKRPTPGKSSALVATPARPEISVEVRKITMSPDATRALAQVVFDAPTATANYDFVLQKHAGDWIVASVWLGEQKEKQELGVRN